jgi:predicted  nucleic acid-binding Zn-ribbon protein
LIDKYYDLKENQNEEIDGIIEKYLVKFDQSEVMIKQISNLEKLWRKAVRERDELEARELQLKNQMIEREIVSLHDKMKRINLLIQEIQKKLAKCLGVKKKVEDENNESIHTLFSNEQISKRAVSPVPNGSSNQQLIWMKEKYSSYLFSYLKDVIDETKPYAKSMDGSMLTKSIFKSNLTGKDSRVSSVRDPFISESKTSKLKEYEDLIETKRNQVQQLNNDLQKINFEKSQLKGQKILIENDLSEIGNSNSKLVEENQALSQDMRSIKNHLLNMLKNPNISYEDVVNIMKAKLNMSKM